MKSLSVILRCCELETGTKPKRDCRPIWYSKEKCLENLLDSFFFKQVPDLLIKFYTVHDGPTGPLYSKLEQLTDHDNFSMYKVNYNSNEGSLKRCLELAKDVDTDYIYFVEDDYLHVEDSCEIIIEGLQKTEEWNPNYASIVTGYCHPDRFSRNDDIDRGKTYLFLGNKNYWRTAESTTCTWATTKSNYNNTIFPYAVKHLLNDRAMFRELHVNGCILFTPMPGTSTHCHVPFMSPFIDWKAITNG